MTFSPTIFAVFETRSAWSARQPLLAARCDYARFLEDEKGIKTIIEDIGSAGITVIQKHFEPGILKGLLSELETARQPMLWNLTDGYDYYAGSNLPAFMRLAGIPHVGSGSYVQMLCQNKHHLKAVADTCGIPIASGINFNRHAIRRPSLPPTLVPPYFVKPTCLDNSIGDRIAAPICVDAAQAITAVEKLFAAGINDVLVEEFLPGLEYSVVAANTGTWLLECVRVQHNGPGYFSSETKDANAFTCVVTDGDGERAMIALTHKLAQCIGLRDYFRADFRCDAAGRPRFLEVNSAPFLASFAYNELAEKHRITRATLLRDMILQSYARQQTAQ